MATKIATTSSMKFTAHRDMFYSQERVFILDINGMQFGGGFIVKHDTPNSDCIPTLNDILKMNDVNEEFELSL